MNNKKYYYGIDIIKYIMAIFVVAIHVGPFSMFGKEAENALDIFIRLAVPFFFCCSGFFLRKKLDNSNDDTEYRKSIFNYEKRVLWLYFIWTIIYIPCIAFWYYKDKKTPLMQIKEIIFDGSYLHLWYLPSLAVAALLASLLYRYIKLKYICVIAIILYIIGLCDNVWYKLIAREIPYLKVVINKYDLLFITTRNGLFFGFAFVVLGFVAVDIVIKMKSSIILFVLSMILLTFENFVYYFNKTSKINEGYIMTLTSVLFLFMIAKNITITYRPVLEYFRVGGVLIYFTHCWVDFTYSVLCFNILHRSFNSIIRFLYTVAITVTLSIILYKLQKKEKFKIIRKLY